MKHLAREAITQTVETCCAQLYGKGSLIGHHYLGHAEIIRGNAEIYPFSYFS